MNESPKQFKTARELKSEIAAMNIRLAFQEELEEEIAVILNNPVDESFAEKVDQATPRVLSRIRRTTIRPEARLNKHVFRKVIHALAACLLLFYLGLTTAIAASSTVRIALVDFVIQIEEKYSTIGLVENEHYVDIPEVWEGYYFPTYLPDGYEVIYSSEDMIQYSNQQGRRIICEELTRDAYTNIDTEGASVSYVQLHGTRAMVSEKGEWTIVTWAVNSRYFIVYVQGPVDVAIRIAESYTMIK